MLIVVTNIYRLDRTRLVSIALGCILCCLSWSHVAAAAANTTVAQGYQTDTSNGTIVPGALVSMSANSTHSVKLANTDSSNRLIGVVDANAFVVLSSGNQETQVVLNGSANVLVSDINGDVHVGDKITVSPIAGVGMVATADSRIIGTAQGDFNVAGSESYTLTDRSGKKRTVHVGHIPLQVGVSTYQVPNSGFVPPFVQDFANAVAGRQVSLVRILISGVLLVACFTSVAALIYTSIRSGMTAIGRNPLASNAIRKSQLQAGLVAVAIIGGTLLANYLILIL
jgi:hypothetical protein